MNSNCHTNHVSIYTERSPRQAMVSPTATDRYRPRPANTARNSYSPPASSMYHAPPQIPAGTPPLLPSKEPNSTPTSPPQPHPSPLIELRQVQRHTTPPPRPIPLHPADKLPRLRQLTLILELEARILNPDGPTFTERTPHRGGDAVAAGSGVGEGVRARV